MHLYPLFFFLSVALADATSGDLVQPEPTLLPIPATISSHNESFLYLRRNSASRGKGLSIIARAVLLAVALGVVFMLISCFKAYKKNENGELVARRLAEGGNDSCSVGFGISLFCQHSSSDVNTLTRKGMILS